MRLVVAMMGTARRLVDEIQGCRLAYVQSDEISLFLRTYDTEATQPWFGGVLPKIVSVSASLVTAMFRIEAEAQDLDRMTPALFDSRAFTLPPHEVTNYFIWRQLDAIRNSIQMLAS
jgi:tRNA(His) 5'-end guanylyltransferase